MTSRAWCVCTIAAATAVCLLVAGTNFVVDPWALNNAISVEGFNRLKPDPLNMVRLRKAYEVVRAKPSAVVMGTSTAEHGIGMEHVQWRGYGRAYNFSMPGATISEIHAFLRRLHEISPVRLAVIGLDFQSFNANREANAQTAQALDAMGNPIARLKPYFTRGMLAASLDTMLRQPGLFEYSLPSGQSSAAAFEQWRVRSKGHYHLFTFSVRQTVRGFLSKPAYRFELQRGGEPSSVENLRALLEFARHEGIELRLYISPIHAWQLETIRAMGLWPMFEYWKQQVALAVDPYRRGQGVMLWDFADYNEISAEPVPKPEDVSARMHWFWDVQHYRTDLGDLIQDQITSSSPPPAGAGVALTASNAGARLLAVREHQREYRESHPEDVAIIERIVAATLRTLR